MSLLAVGGTGGAVVEVAMAVAILSLFLAVWVRERRARKRDERNRMMRTLIRPLTLLTGAIAAALVLVGCGGSSTAEGTTTSAASEPAQEGSLQARLDAQPGENVGLILGTSDFAVGENRLSFLVVGGNGQLVEAPTAKVYVARTLADTPESTADARLLKLDPHGDGSHTQKHVEPDAEALFVTRLTFPKAGRYWLVVDLPGKPTQGLFALDVKEKAAAPAVGEKAPPSDNPTLADAPAKEITTARPPDRELLRSSVKDALAAKVPFVVVFATPQYCTSRTCGPTVEIVDEVRRRSTDSEVRFIHVEVYKDNDPAKDVNRWMTEWKLPSEPWIFVVDDSGVIRTRFEGSASVEELEAAVKAVS